MRITTEIAARTMLSGADATYGVPDFSLSARTDREVRAALAAKNRKAQEAAWAAEGLCRYVWCDERGGRHSTLCRPENAPSGSEEA